MDRLTTTAYGSSFVALFGGMTTNDVAMIGGLMVGVATFAVNCYFKREHLKIARREAQKRELD
ncbi:phage holin [Marinomonas spartinae]|uniref:phage holin n=1 Tax=Marinomonas spartinae TaxID=1792290 RepID=UPI0018F1B48E|nr:phage holin [Marinomonas spartinae]MBJ7556566.1 hypothetical protein [Marinomonas spartinae]